MTSCSATSAASSTAWDVQQAETLVADRVTVYDVRFVLPFFRVQLTNGVDAQTTLRLTTIYQPPTYQTGSTASFARGEMGGYGVDYRMA